MPVGQISTLDVEALYCDHHGWLQGWLRRKLGNALDAADLAQDTFVRVLRGSDRALPCEPIREPRAYLATIANGLVSSHWRRHALEQSWLAVQVERPEFEVPSQEQRALILEALEEIALLLDGMPARTREIFLLSQIDRLTYPQIAQQLGTTVNVVQKAMTRAVACCYKTLYANG